MQDYGDSAKPIRFRVQQGVQRLFHAAPNHPVEVAPNPFIVNRDDLAQWTRCSGGVVCSFYLLIRWAHPARCQAETPPIVLCRFPRPAILLGKAAWLNN